MTIVDNGADGQYATRVELDIEGNQRSVTDARLRVVARYDYDLLKRRLHQSSMEAGERWMLADVAGKPIYAEDSRGHQFRTEYDELRRPVRQFVRGTDAVRSDPRTLNLDVLFQKIDYGERQPNPETLNLRTRAFRQYDAAGIVTNEEYDFKGNLLSSNRALAREYQPIIDWLGAVPTDDVFESSTTWDALNRPVTLTTPDKTVLVPKYNEANLLESLDGYLKGAATITNFITNLDYNARGQRVLCAYAKAATTTYHYDPLTFRLIELDTTGDLQSLKYTYDPVGNLTFIEDDAQQTIYFLNQRIEPHNDYTYDAIYRLKAAIGREHLGQVGGSPAPTSATDGPRVGIQHRANGQAMGRYLQQYIYDEVGNLLQMSHQGTDPTNSGWTRSYKYNEQSLIDSAEISNRLTSTTIGVITESYSHDAHGNLTFMPPLPTLKWDYKDQLLVSSPQVVNTGTPETTYYVYDAGGQRVRKVTVLPSGLRKSERIYLGGFELYRHYDSSDKVDVERETLHVMDGQQRVALVETRTQGTDDGLPQLTRYQLGNHLGSSVLELDENGQIISYEEYYPYGSTSYQGVRNKLETPKRYRYTGKERDEETGLSYHGARYYAPWLGRWTSCDPALLIDGTQPYKYSSNNPVGFVDRTGLAPNQSVPDADPTIPNASFAAANQSVCADTDCTQGTQSDTTSRIATKSEMHRATVNGVKKAAETQGPIAVGLLAAARFLGGTVALALGMIFLESDRAPQRPYVDPDTPAAAERTGADVTTGVIAVGSVAAGLALSETPSAAIVESTEETLPITGAARGGVYGQEPANAISGTIETPAPPAPRGNIYGSEPANAVSGVIDVPEPAPAVPAPGSLRSVAPGTWESNAGLRYGPGSAQGNRVLHVLEHAEDIPGRVGSHGVFAGGRGGVIAAIDETYRRALAGGPDVVVDYQGNRTVYTVNYRQTVGYVGGQAGAALGNPGASHIRLVVEGTNVITAFPLIP